MIRALKSKVDEVGFADDRPRFTEVKPKAFKVTSEPGKVVTFEAVTAGQKPIGKWTNSYLLIHACKDKFLAAQLWLVVALGTSFGHCI